MIERKCPKCGTTMCEQFEYKPGPNPSVSLAIPTGKFDCMKCRREGRAPQSAPEKDNDAKQK